MYQVNEIFYSIQGEGFNAGQPSAFVRLQGCTVGCQWCDTKYTWKKGGVSMSTADIVTLCKFVNVVITGGEPTLYDLDELIIALRENGHRIAIETSGQNPLKGNEIPDWMTVSPKPNLGFNISSGVLSAVVGIEIKFVADMNLTDEVIASVMEDAKKHCYLGGNWPMFCVMPEGAPPTAPMRARALSFALHHEILYSDRLQYILEVK